MTTGKWAVLILLVLALGTSAAIFFVFRNADELDGWLGRQVVGIANYHLAPELDFEDLEYQAPGLIRLDDATLTAQDGTRVLDIGEMTITLAEVPRIGRPIKIAALTVKDGTLKVHRDPETGKIAGLLPILDPDIHEQDDEDVPSEFRLSNVMRLEKIDLVNLSIEYREGDQRPMTLTGLSTQLLIDDADQQAAAATSGAVLPVAQQTAAGQEPPAEPASEPEAESEDERGAAPGAEPPDPPEGKQAEEQPATPPPPPPADEPGWYVLDLDVGRSPGLTVQGEGRFNLDTFTLDLSGVQVGVTVDRTTIDSLPPQLQSLLRKHDASGALSLTVSGLLPLKDPMNSSVTGQLRLRDFDFSAGKYRFPLQVLQTPISVSSGVAKIGPLVAQVHDGEIDAFVTANLNAENRPADVEWSVTGIDLHEFLRSDVEASKTVGMGGIVTSSGNATTTLTAPKDELSGRGSLTIEDGTLLFLPGLKQIADLMNVVLRAEGTHEMEAQFELNPQGIQITESKVITEVLAARAQGLVAFDGSINLTINAGPLEKVQSLLGEVGNILGQITDQLMKYRVKGTVKDPKVSVEVL